MMATLGLQAVDRHKVDANIRLKMPDLSLDEHHQLYNHCWDLPQREYQVRTLSVAKPPLSYCTV